jgi:hypothetical protein
MVTDRPSTLRTASPASSVLPPSQLTPNFLSITPQISDTSITISPLHLRPIADVERNGSCFTDGVGKISPSLFAKV